MFDRDGDGKISFRVSLKTTFLSKKNKLDRDEPCNLELIREIYNELNTIIWAAHFHIRTFPL